MQPPTPSPSSGRVFLWRLALAFVLTSTAAAVGLGGSSFVLEHKFAQANSVKVDLDSALPGSINILLLGSDSRAFVDDTADEKSFGDTKAVGGQRADVIIIARVEPKTRRGVLVSIPRDTLVHLPKYKGLVLINQSFEDGPQGVINAIKSNFGVPINHYAEIGFDGFRKMVDAIGGVRMYVPAPSRDHPGDPKNRGTGLDIKNAGCQTFNGTTALAWVRSRYFQYYEAGKWHSDPTSDLGRISRQQDFIRRLMAQAVEKGALNPIRASHLADAAMANLTVDSTFNVKDALRLVQAFRPVGAAGIEMVSLPTKPVGVHLAVAPEAQPILARLRGEVPRPAGGEASATAKAPKVTPADVKVRVLNGTGTAGAAGDTAGELGRAGFSPAGSGDAVTFGYAKTEIRYAPAAQAKAAFLARYLNGVGKLVADAGVKGTDLVLIVGADWQGVTAPAASGQAAAPASTTTAAPTTATTGSGPTTAPKPAGGPAQPAC
ncbi:MAG TPA: LCP family protein [Acidimicrobiia bacterium]|nr:LCP family protein [Acidimicrobiia bacterium]